MTPAELGVVAAKRYVESCEGTGARATRSVIDLTKLEEGAALLYK